jgi:pimeloyl-ACP methyl ester carboxylesterase
MNLMRPLVLTARLNGFELGFRCFDLVQLRRSTAMNGIAMESIFALTILMHVSMAQMTPNNVLRGNWVGEYTIGGKRTYVSVGVRVAENTLTATLREPVEDSSALPVSRISFRSSVLHFELQTQSATLIFEGQLKDNMVFGELTNGERQGTFQLLHLADTDSALFTHYVGDYELDDKAVFVVGRSLTSLYYRDTTTERTGPLLPVSATEYIGGPAVGVHYPVEIRVKFVRNVAGETTGLILVRNGLPEKVANKIRLYNEETVRIHNGDVILAGTLTKPLRPASYPTVILLHGSNAQSRYGQNAFLSLVAEHFARHGIAVLAYDKRGVGESTGKQEDLDLETDALAAVEFLRRRSDIDPKAIGLWGISQGGMLAPQVASLTSIAFIINTSGAVVDGHEQEIERTELQLRADGFPEKDIRDAVALQKLKFHYARTGEGWDEYIAAIDKAKDKKWFPDPYVGPPTTKDSEAWAVWRKGSGSFSPADFWAKYRGPVLLIFGTHETYCLPSANIAAFKEAMAKAHNNEFTIEIIPQAEHGMRVAKTGGEKELILLNRYAPHYFDVMTNWIGRIVRGPKSSLAGE